MAGNPNMSYVDPVLGATETHRANVEASAAKTDAMLNQMEADAMGSTAMAMAIKIGQLRDDLFAAKKALHGQIALRDSLKSALEKIAPEHELVIDRQKRLNIVEAAEATTKPEDPWWP